jgi:hypothetical protein
MTPVDAVAATKKTISRSGGAFMLHPATIERAGELGLQPFPFYYLGRCGVLGDVDPDLVATIIAFFPPALVAKSWRKGRAVLTPQDAAQAYAECCWAWGRTHLAEADGLDRLCELAERVVTAADPVGLPLFAGWRALPLPDDVPARAAQLLNVLREHRGGLHITAVIASGLSGLDAAVAGPYGADTAKFFGWVEPFPEVTTDLGERHERAEILTDELAAPAYAVLDAADLAAFVELCGDVKAAAKAATA